MHRCYIAIGGNVGDVSQAIGTALKRLSGPDLRVAGVSRLYVTPPMGSEAGGTFLNAAAAIETSLEPLALLDRLLAVEHDLGRRRSVHWGPRPIDLDLVLYRDLVIEHTRLRVPHPACWYRRFVLDPLAEIAPETVHPEAVQTIEELRNSLLPRPLGIGIEVDESSTRDIVEQLGGPDVLVTNGRRAALTLRIGWEGSSARERWIGVPHDHEPRREAVSAIFAAALGVPAPAGQLPYA